MDGKETRFVLLVKNHITEALKNKDELETTRALMDETEELLRFGSWSWDIGTNAVTATHGLYTLLERSPADADSTPGLTFFLSHIQGENRAAFEQMITDSIRDKMDFSCEFAIRTAAGALKEISASGKLVTNADGEIEKVVCINRDITALRTFEKEQERSKRELNRSNKEVEEFAYVASHDLQEPLRKISMFTERLKAKYQHSLDPEGDLFIERILASAANMKTLIESLLDFSRLGRRSHTFDNVDLQSVFESVVSDMKMEIGDTQQAIRFAGDMPTIEGVTSEMKQLFGNILSNAVKFRKSGKPIEISVSAGALPKKEKEALGLPDVTYHRIAIQDNGIGFDPEYSERIFQIFQRLNGKSEYPGSGIGLTICKKIVEKHNGLIFATGQPDAGAVFTVILPEKQM